MHGDRGSRVSASAQSFVRALMEVEPAKRLSAHTALAHPWLASSMPSTREIDPSVTLLFWAFSDAPKLQRCYMSMMASCFTNKEQAAVREQFMALDKQHRGAITLDQLRSGIIAKFQGSSVASCAARAQPWHLSQLLLELCKLPSQQYVLDGVWEIHYCVILAAMAASQLHVSVDSVRATFQKFEDGSGCIRSEDLCRVVGERFEGGRKFCAALKGRTFSII